MSKLLAVFGATGQQDALTINYLPNDTELSQKYKIRAITRDANSEKVKQLKDILQVVLGDVLNRPFLETALTGAHTAFATTTPPFGPDGLGVEYNCDKTIVDARRRERCRVYQLQHSAASQRNLRRQVHQGHPLRRPGRIRPASSRPSYQGRILLAGIFHGELPVPDLLSSTKSSGLHLGTSRHTAAKTQFPFVDTAGDTSKLVGAIVAEPDKYEGKRFCAAPAIYSWEEVTAIMSKERPRR